MPDDVVAFALDEALAAVDDIAIAWARKGGAAPPAGQRFTNDQDFDDEGGLVAPPLPDWLSEAA